jgi:hypothetical protein
MTKKRCVTCWKRRWRELLRDAIANAMGADEAALDGQNEKAANPNLGLATGRS